MAGLEVSGLTLRSAYGAVVRRLDLRLAPGEAVALLGASGSGKSLTARTLAGAVPAGIDVSGVVRVGGRDVSRVPAARRRPEERVALVGQDPAAALHPLRTVGAQVAAPLRRAGHRDPGAGARDLLTAVHLDPALALRQPGQLSGGQRQRVCVAVALACPPPVLVADEPTSSLDVVAQAAVLAALRQVADRGRSLLLVTHDLAAAATVADRVLVLHDGRIVEEGRLDTVLAAPGHAYTRRLVAAAHGAALPAGTWKPTG